jgi:hypothetical protein
MFMRFISLLAFAGLVTLPAPARAFEDAHSNPPTLLVRISSIQELKEDVKYLSALVSRPGDAKKFDEQIQQRFPKGLKGVDTHKPLAVYARLDPGGNPTDSTGVALVPITDEKDFLALLEDFHLNPKKEEDGLYSVTPQFPPVPFYFRFADGYALITAKEKEAISKAKVLPLERVFPPGQTDTISVTFRIDQIPDSIKQIGAGQVELRVSELEEKRPPGQTDAEHALHAQAIKEVGKELSSIIQDGTQLQLLLNVDRQAGQFLAELSLAGKKDSKLAQEIAATGTGKSRFAGLASGPASILLNFKLPAAMQEALAARFDEAVQERLKKESDQFKREILAKVIKALAPTIKAGALDAAASLRGPSTNNHYAFVAAMGIKDGQEVEKSLRDVVKQLPDIEKKLKLDAETIDGVKVHRINIQEDMKPDVKKKLGDEPLYVAIRSNAAFVAGGDGGLDALKGALASAPQSALPFDVKISAAGIAPLMDREKHKKDPVEVSHQVFGQGAAHDKIHFSLQGGDSIKLRAVVDADAVKFFSQVGPGGKMKHHSQKKHGSSENSDIRE